LVCEFRVSLLVAMLPFTEDLCRRFVESDSC
jgi:hypothetical protein